MAEKCINRSIPIVLSFALVGLILFAPVKLYAGALSCYPINVDRPTSNQRHAFVITSSGALYSFDAGEETPANYSNNIPMLEVLSLINDYRKYDDVGYLEKALYNLLSLVNERRNNDIDYRIIKVLINLHNLLLLINDRNNDIDSDSTNKLLGQYLNDIVAIVQDHINDDTIFVDPEIGFFIFQKANKVWPITDWQFVGYSEPSPLEIYWPAYVEPQRVYASVIKVVDGDTLLLSLGDKEIYVRLIGIDAPETEANEKAKRDAYSANQNQYINNMEYLLLRGRTSTKFVEGLVKEGDRVVIETDKNLVDTYGRLLAYVYLYDTLGKMLNIIIVENGFAYPMSIEPNVRYDELIKHAKQEAYSNKEGFYKPDWIDYYNAE